MGAALTTTITAAGSLVAAGLGHQFDIPVLAPAALAAAGAVGTAVQARTAGATWPTVAYRCGCWLTAGMWTAWSTLTGPWHGANLIAGGAAALIGGLISPAFTTTPDPEPATGEQAATVDAKWSRDPRAREWAARIQRIAKIQPVTITDVQDWDTGTGFTLHAVFAAESGDTWTAIRDVAPRIAGAARLPKGCAVSVDEGDIQGTAVVRVATVYALAEDVYLPGDCSPLSIWGDLPVGINEDGTPALINLRQASGLFAGRRGGGKTNLLKVIIGQLLRCPDTIVWVADLNGGGLAVPFMLPYADGDVDVPPIDWVASTPAEVTTMATVAARIAEDRKARYAALTARSGGDLLPVSKDLPQITIVVDESAEVENDPEAREAMQALLKVQRIGRAEAVNVLFSALRATNDTIPVPIRKQTSLKICLQVEDGAELSYMLPEARVRQEDLVHPGTAYLRRGDVGAAVRQIKIYRTLPDNIQRLVQATADHRGCLDAPGQQIGGRLYAERLQRLGPWLARMRGEDVPDQPAGTVQAASAAAQRPLSSAPEDRKAHQARARLGLQRFVAKTRLDDEKELENEFAAITAQLGPADVAGEKPSGWSSDLLLDLVSLAGPDGVTPSEMRDQLATRGITVSMKTIHEHLKRFREAEPPRVVTEGGRYRMP